MAPPCRAEKKYIQFLSRYKNHVHWATSDSVQEGFEYFFESPEYREKYGDDRVTMKTMFLANGIDHTMGLLRIFWKYMIPMMRGRNRCFTDLAPYLKELEYTQHISNTSRLMESSPNREIWEDIVAYARNRHNVTIGFTELPRDLIFKGKGVLFRHVLVCIQEMDKDKIDAAPALQAGEEVQRVYNSLGHSANDIAQWLRKKYAIKCQANHPLGGLVNSPPLAGKAGLGWQGMDGMLVTPQYGKRQRIALIFLQEKYFKYTDSRDHTWLESYCQTCKRCRKACPAGAIYDARRVANNNNPDIVIKTCIDREKCFPQFARTLGCSICIKVCPFSNGGGVYEKIKCSFHAHAV